MRALNPIEHSFTLINDFYPFVATCVLKVSGGPEPELLRTSLNRLQELHPLLNATIRKRNKQFWFDKNEDTVPVPLQLISRKDAAYWEDIVRDDLNHGFTEKGLPLMRVSYLRPSADQEDAEIIISFHHAIVDASYIMHMADQLLSLVSAGENKVGEPGGFLPFPPAPDLASILPRAFRGPRFFLRLIPFMYRQLKDETIYKKTNKGIPDAKIPGSSENDIGVLRFSKSETQALIRWSRRKRISINGLLSAAMLILTNEKNYGGRKKLLRTLQFGNLRPYLQPSLKDSAGGSFVSMMRYTVALQPGSTLAATASVIDRQSLKASRRGDKFMFALVSKFLIRKTIRDHRARLGAAALSYLGPVSLKQQYGATRVNAVHGYISNNCLGAELTGFAKIFSEELSIDLNFLTAELSREEARETAHDLKQLILRTLS